MFLHNTGPIFLSILVSWPLLEAQFLGKFAFKIDIFGVQTGEWASIRAWASNRDFTVQWTIRSLLCM